MDVSERLRQLRYEHANPFSEGVTVYEVGKYVYPDGWDTNRWEECSHGIHFFLTREQAEAW